MKQYVRIWKTFAAPALIAVALSLPAAAVPILSENFNNVAGLTGSGWVIVNESTPLGTTSWFQGNDAIFPAQTGAANSYAGANFNAADFGGNVSLFLITPVINHVGAVTVTFWTRTESSALPGDNLQLLLNPANTTNTGDFSQSLFSSPSTYPDSWTLVTANATLAGPSRLAFRYSVTDTSANGNYIGIDTFSVDAATGAIPEPATYLFSSMGLLAVIALRRRTSGQIFERKE